MGMFRVSDDFEQFVRDINKRMNDFLMEQGMQKRLTLPQTTDMLILEPAVFISPKELIKKSPKGKRLIFEGEIKL